MYPVGVVGFHWQTFDHLCYSTYSWRLFTWTQPQERFSIIYSTKKSIAVDALCTVIDTWQCTVWVCWDWTHWPVVCTVGCSLYWLDTTWIPPQKNHMGSDTNSCRVSCTCVVTLWGSWRLFALCSDSLLCGWICWSRQWNDLFQLVWGHFKCLTRLTGIHSLFSEGLTRRFISYDDTTDFNSKGNSRGLNKAGLIITMTSSACTVSRRIEWQMFH